MRDLVAICFENISRPRAAAIVVVALAAGAMACADRGRPDPVETFSTRIALDGTQPASFSRTLQRGAYLVEIRERDIDARVVVETSGTRTTLEDRLARHGVVYKVVSLTAPAPLRIEITSADHASKRGSVELRVARWQRDLAAPPSELESGYVAVSAAAELAAVGKTESWAGAADKLHEALSHFEAADDEAARGQAAYSLAYVQYGPRDQFAAAVRACETAAEAFGKAHDEFGVRNAETLRAAAEIELASSMNADTQRAEQRALFAEADRRLGEAAEWFKSHSYGVRAEYAVNMRAVRAVALGDYEAAATLLGQALTMARANEDVREQTVVLSNLAAVHSYLGEIALAASEYEALLPLLDKAKQPYPYAGILSNYGFTMIALGDFDRALELHTEALDIYTQIGEEDERAVELSALGGLYFRMGDARRALDTLQSAIVAQERVADTGGLAGTLRLAGNAASVLEQHPAALEYLERSARIDADPHSVARTEVLIAGELRASGDLAAAEARLGNPLRSTNELVLANALEERARIRMAKRDGRAAIEDLRAADAHYAELGLEINRIDTQTALSKALLDANDRDGASDAADAAIAIVSRIRVKSGNPEWRARFLSARYAPYEARIAVDMRDTANDAAWRAFRVADEVRARSLADELAVGPDAGSRAIDPAEAALRARLTSLQLHLESDLQRQSGDEVAMLALRRSIAETRAQIDTFRARNAIAARELALPESLDRAQKALPRDTAVLAYFVGDSGGFAWLLTQDSLHHVALPGRAALERAILAAQREERAGTPAGAAARQLSRTLLGSLLDSVTSRRLLLLTDGPLNSVPFAALPLPGSDGELLVDRFVMASAPSMALAMSHPARARTRSTRIAVVSDPVYAPDDRRLTLAMRDEGTNLRGPAPSPNNLTRLPYSALEASAVTKAFGAETTIQLAGFDAVAARVLELPSRDLAVLHFATHAVARNDSPDQSALFLTEYARDGTLLPSSRVTVNDIARSGLRADVVVLSGCATGDGGALRGEGVLGLTYGFLANGSHSVVASLWPIEDASTARFMNEFYRAYRESRSAAEALRAAQLRTRATSTSGVWSSFVVRADEFP